MEVILVTLLGCILLFFIIMVTCVVYKVKTAEKYSYEKVNKTRIIIHSASADASADLSADMPEERFIKLKILLKHSRML